MYMYLKIQIHTSLTEELKYVKYKCVVQYKSNSTKTKLSVTAQDGLNYFIGLKWVKS